MDAPDITVESTEGVFNPSHVEKGVVYFYPKDDTPGCTTEACRFRDRYDAFTSAGFEIYGVSNDSIESHERFLNKYDLPFVLVADVDAELSRAFGVYDQQEFDGESFMGITRSTFIIEDGDVVDEFRGVDPDSHWEDVLRAVKELD